LKLLENYLNFKIKMQELALIHQEVEVVMEEETEDMAEAVMEAETLVIVTAEETLETVMAEEILAMETVGDMEVEMEAEILPRREIIPAEEEMTEDQAEEAKTNQYLLQVFPSIHQKKISKNSAGRTI